MKLDHSATKLTLNYGPKLELEYLASQPKIALIGGGWYGCQTALSIKKAYPNATVTIFDKCPDIFDGISGTFGNRLHTGTHYPRSSLTRDFCHKGYNEFYATYPELINEHSHSYYGLGIEDVDGNPPKVTKEEFAAVCNEFGESKELPLDNFPNLQYIADIKEPSLVMGVQLRNFFNKKLKDLGIQIRCNIAISSVKEKEDGKCILETYQGESFEFDYVINATGFQTLLPKELLNVKTFYQACFALVYEQNIPSPKPFSFIVMDGQFPSLMPFDDRPDKTTPITKYVLTHASVTLSKHCETFEEAEAIYERMRNSSNEIRLRCEDIIKGFLPNFSNEFTHRDFIGVIIVKVDTPEDFRCACVFQSNGLIHIIPGKVSNALQAGREVVSLIKNENIVNEGNCSYIKEGMFDLAQKTVFKQSSYTGFSFFKQNASNESMPHDIEEKSLSIKC